MGSGIPHYIRFLRHSAPVSGNHLSMIPFALNSLWSRPPTRSEDAVYALGPVLGNGVRPAPTFSSNEARRKTEKKNSRTRDTSHVYSNHL